VLRVRIEALRRPNDQYQQQLQRGEIGNLAFLKAGFYQQRLFGDPYCCLARKRHPSVGPGFSL
jgi:hypothetical protein